MTGPPDPPFVLFLNGGYGVGKSAALDLVGDVLAEAGRPFSLFDVDWFHRSWPPAADDPENVLAEAANLRAVWQSYRSAGARQPVVAGVLRDPVDRGRYADVFGLPVRSVRLEASAAVTRARLHGRYPGERSGPLAWHLDRYAQLAARLTATAADELVLQTDDVSPRAVAEQVCAWFGLRG